MVVLPPPPWAETSALGKQPASGGLTRAARLLRWVTRGLSPTLISLNEARYSHFRQPDDGGGLVGRSTSAADRSSDVRGSRCAPTDAGSTGCWFTGCGNSAGGVAVVDSGGAAACLPMYVPGSLGCGLTGLIPLRCSGPMSGRSGTPVGSVERCCVRKSP